MKLMVFAVHVKAVVIVTKNITASVHAMHTMKLEGVLARNIAEICAGMLDCL